MRDLTQETIGKLHTAILDRDAIHVAVLAVVADEDIYPGEVIKLVPGTTNLVRADRVGQYGRGEVFGVADPFISRWDRIPKGSRFWAFLRPGTVTGLRHHWEHPAVDNPSILDQSERWLRHFADRWGFDYNQMIAVATNPTQDEWGEWAWITAHGVDLHSREELGDEHRLFWEHLGQVTGRHYDEEHQQKVQWSCTC